MTNRSQTQPAAAPAGYADALNGEAGTDGAMTEIALALAMAFFSLMVLTMVSMASPGTDGSGVAAGDRSLPPLLDLSSPAAASDASLASDDRLLILHRGRFLDAALRPVAADGIGAGRVVLAVDPDAALSAILAARETLGGREVVITALDAAWRRRLREGE